MKVIRMSVVLVLSMIAIDAVLAASSSAAWAYCGSPSSSRGNVSTTIAISTGGTALCPSVWSTAYPQCGTGVQAPVSFSAVVPIDSKLRPFDLSWFRTTSFYIVQSPEPQLKLVPVDVNPALWDPNELIAYSLRYARILSPSEHAFN